MVKKPKLYDQVKRLVHIDFLNMDKSRNTDGDITNKQDVDTDEEQHIVYCNCGNGLSSRFLSVVCLCQFLWVLSIRAVGSAGR